MRVLVIGSGGREHAICWRLRRSPRISALFCAPGNPGVAEVAECLPLAVDDLDGLAHFAEREKIDLTIVGPEFPLSLGIVDRFRAQGLRIFGPTQAAARIEASKSFAKEIMTAAGVPTAGHRVFTDGAEAQRYIAEHGAPIVLKADGLAAGKGVFVCLRNEEALSAIDRLFGEFKSEQVVAEEFLTGKEVSFIVATDGTRVVPLASSHDYKRIGDGDSGANTGGMGAVSPTPNLPAERNDWVVEHVMQPVVDEMRRRGTPFEGFLYAGLMVHPDGGIKVLEFNARLGDPETQVIMRRLESDLIDLLDAMTPAPRASAQSTSRALPLPQWSEASAVCVVIAAEGYPGDVRTGDEISGIPLAEALTDLKVFQAGTKSGPRGAIVSAGGRVLNVTALGSNLANARSLVYRGVDMIQFRGCQLRRDIAAGIAAFLLLSGFATRVWAGELKVLDALGLVRAARQISAPVTVRVTLRNGAKDGGAMTLENVDGLAASVPAQPGTAPDEYLFKPVPEGSWRITAPSTRVAAVRIDAR